MIPSPGPTHQVVRRPTSEVVRGHVLLAVVDRGDEVLLIEPYFDSYAAGVALAGATRRCVSLVADQDRFAVDLDAVAAAITPATRVLVVNSPHNPTGSVFTRTELAGLAALAIEMICW